MSIVDLWPEFRNIASVDSRVIVLIKPGYLPMGLLATFLTTLIITYLIASLRRPRRSLDGHISPERYAAHRLGPRIVLLSAATLVLNQSRIQLLYPWPRPARVIEMSDLEQVKIVHRDARYAWVSACAG